MPFTNAAIYYRTHASRAAVTPDPVNLPTAQVIHFNSDTLRLQSFQEVEKSNIVDVPGPNASGNRKINIEDNGALTNVFRLAGAMAATETANITKLKGFRRRLQKETTPDTHIYGTFGIAWPKVSSFSVDPDGTQGLAIQELQWNHSGAHEFVAFTITIKKYGDSV